MTRPVYLAPGVGVRSGSTPGRRDGLPPGRGGMTSDSAHPADSRNQPPGERRPLPCRPGDRFGLAGPEGHHAATVKRASPGEEIDVVDGLAVCSNGAITLDLARDEAFNVHTFDPSRQVAALHAELPEALYAVESLHEPRRLTAHFPDGELTGPSVVVPIDELAIPDATRLTVRYPGMGAGELMDAVHAAGLRGAEYAIGWTAWLDVSPEGVSKAAALEDVRQSCGAAPSSTLAVGDGGNDVEMLGWATLGVAMGDAGPSVKQAADAVTTGVDADGLALVLELLL